MAKIWSNFVPLSLSNGQYSIYIQVYDWWCCYLQTEKYHSWSFCDNNEMNHRIANVQICKANMALNEHIAHKSFVFWIMYVFLCITRDQERENNNNKNNQ